MSLPSCPGKHDICEKKSKKKKTITNNNFSIYLNFLKQRQCQSTYRPYLKNMLIQVGTKN